MAVNLNLISLNKDIFISIDTLTDLTNHLIKSIADVEPTIDMSEEFILGSMNGMEFLKKQLSEQIKKFYVEVELTELGFDNGLVKKINVAGGH